MGKMKKVALVLVFGMAASVLTFASDWRDINHDRADVRQDYRQRQRDERDHDWRAAQQERADIARDRADMRRDIRHDGWWRDHDGRWHSN